MFFLRSLEFRTRETIALYDFSDREPNKHTSEREQSAIRISPTIHFSYLACMLPLRILSSLLVSSRLVSHYHNLIVTTTTRVFRGMHSDFSWQQLPPRGIDQSHRQRRRFVRDEAIALSSSASGYDESEHDVSVDVTLPSVGDLQKPQQSTTNEALRPQQIQSTPRKNRPGFNSYLKVVLDDKTLQRLNQDTVRIAESVKLQQQSQRAIIETAEAAKQASNDNIDSSGTASNIKTRSNKRPLAIKLRSLQSLHVTLFFGGETLCHLPENELVSFHSQVTAELQQRGFFQSNSGDTTSKDLIFPISSESVFTIKEYCLFPPRRNNLIVALLDAPSEWVAIHDCIREIAKRSESQALREVVQYGNKARWTPHITLANVVGGSKEELRELQTHLLFVSQAFQDKDSIRGSVCKIAMGGPMPAQVELDWDFYVTRG